MGVAYRGRNFYVEGGNFGAGAGNDAVSNEFDKFDQSSGDG